MKKISPKRYDFIVTMTGISFHSDYKEKKSIKHGDHLLSIPERGSFTEKNWQTKCILILSINVNP
jgi:hypothetical protein